MKAQALEVFDNDMPDFAFYNAKERLIIKKHLFIEANAEFFLALDMEERIEELENLLIEKGVRQAL